MSLQASNSPDAVGAARLQVYDFGPFRLDSGKRLLLRSGDEVHLAPKAFDTLLLLIENRGRVLTKDELIKSLWPDTFVEEINLAVHISALRKALGEEPGSHRYIVTWPRRGYTFAADVRETSAGKIGVQQKTGELSAGTGAGWGNDRRLRRTSLREPMVLPAWVLRLRNRIRDLAILAAILIALVGWLAIRRPSRKTQRGYESRNPGAYEAYLRGVTFWNRRTKEGMTKAISYFQQAIQLDQRYALAYSGLADSYYLSGYYGFLPSADAYTLAESAATVAVGIDDNVAAAHTVLALVKIEHQDPKGAESEFERAITVQPDYSTAHQRYAWFLLRTKRLVDRASSEMRRAVELDPLSSVNNIALAQMLYLEGRPDESAEYCNKVIEVDNGFAPAHKYLGLDYQQKEMYAEALDQMRVWGATPQDDLDSVETFGALYAAAGRKAEAERSIAQLTKMSSCNERAMYSLVMLYAVMGEKERAFYWLEKAAKTVASANYLLLFDPRIAVLRTDERFDRIVRRIAMPS